LNERQPVNWALAVQLGLASTLLQLWLCVLISPEPTVFDTYLSFSNWDGEWFLSILENGYISSLPPKRQAMLDSNVAFFPGYPAWAWLVSKITTLSADLALPVASQVTAAGFWILFYAAITRWTQSLAVLIFAGLALAIHSGAFFLQMAYSESLFLMALFAYLLTVGERRLWGVAVLSGIVLSSTRIVGLPIVMVGGWVAMENWPLGWIKRWSECLRQMALSVIASLGGLSFFGYCWYVFGHWDLYMWTQRIGWRIVAKPLAFFAPASWLQWPGLSLPPLSLMPLRIAPDHASRVFTSVYLWVLAATALLEFSVHRERVSVSRSSGEESTPPSSGFRKRLPIYAAAVIIMAVSLSGVYSVGFKSMTRYTFAVHACWLAAFVGLYLEIPARWQLVRQVIIAFALVASLYALILQFRFISLFTRYHWVA
jgi:hypothetical protein